METNSAIGADFGSREPPQCVECATSRADYSVRPSI